MSKKFLESLFGKKEGAEDINNIFEEVVIVGKRAKQIVEQRQEEFRA